MGGCGRRTEGPIAGAALARQVKSYLGIKDHFKIILHHEDLYDINRLNRKLLHPLLERGFRLRGADSTLTFPDFSLDYGKNNPEIYKFTPGDFSGAKAYAENRSLAVSQYTAADLRFIASQLDPAVLAAVDYTLENVPNRTTVEDEALEMNLYQGPSLIVRAERHTGSHFLNAVLRHNFPKEHNSVHGEPIMHSSDCPTAQPLAPGSSCCWKHGYPDERCEYTKQPSAYVFLIRQPFSWLLAMRANP